jgi:hypothetical protein
MTELDILIGDSFLPLLGERARDRFVLVEGPRGTAKTRSILSIIMARALAKPKSRWILARSTRTRLSNSVLVTLEEQVFPAYGLPVPGAAGREHRADYLLPNGSRLIPIGLDDQQRTQSMECAGIYLAEGVELEKQDDALALAGSMRQAGIINPQCIVDCNPGPPGHWANVIAEPVPASLRRVHSREDYQRVLEHNAAPAKGGWKRIVSRHQDNPAYWDHEKWDWTEMGQAYLETLGHLGGHLRRRWLDGDWVAAEGVVFPEFDDTKHVIEPFPIPREWPCIIAKDPGRDHPDATILCGRPPPRRTPRR